MTGLDPVRADVLANTTALLLACGVPRGEARGYVHGTLDPLLLSWLRGERPAAEWCVVLLGATGVGKTTMALRVLVEALAQDGRAKPGRDVLFADVPSWCDELRNGIGRDDGERPFDRARDARLLVLDDVGSARDTPFARDRQSTLLRARAIAGGKTVVTSNAESMSALGQVLDPRVVSRMQDGLPPRLLVGEDRRIARRRERRSD